MKKIFCLVASFFVVGLLGGCGSNVEPPTAVFAENRVGSSAPIETVTVRGVVESVESRNVYSTLGFTVDHVYVEVGDTVTKGQVLAVLDSADLELMIAQQRVEIDTLRRMIEIIPTQRQSELDTMRRMSSLLPQQQQSELGVIRETGENAVQLSRRMFNEAYENLANNTNMHLVGAEASLTAAELNLTSVRLNYETARADYEAGGNSHVVNARVNLDSTETNHERFVLLYEAGGLARNELRQSETALEFARNAYNDAVEFERRALEQLEIALAAAITTHQDATTLLETTRIAVDQELEMFRSNLATAEIATNLEPMEIAMNMASLEISSSLESMQHAVELEITHLTAQLEAAEISLQLMERQLADSQITAPINGTVTAAIATEGAIGMGLLFIVEDTEDLRIMTRFREYDIALIEQGMEAVITADATGNTIHAGEIRRISPTAVHHSHLTEFEVEIAISEHDTGLKIGMNTRIEIDVN